MSETPSVPLIKVVFICLREGLLAIVLNDVLSTDDEYWMES